MAQAPPTLPPPHLLTVCRAGRAAGMVPISQSIKRKPTQAKWLVLTLLTRPESGSHRAVPTNCHAFTRAPEVCAQRPETTLCENVRLALPTAPGLGRDLTWIDLEWLHDPQGTGEATWGTVGCLQEEMTETSPSRKSVFTPAAKCKMILSCQHLPLVCRIWNPICVCLSADWPCGCAAGARNLTRLEWVPLLPGVGSGGSPPHACLLWTSVLSWV